MKQWHFKLSLFWQSKSPRTVFYLILLSRFSSIADFLHCHYNSRSYHYLIEFSTLFWICSVPSLASWSSCLCLNMSSDRYLPRDPMSSLNSLLQFILIWAEHCLPIILLSGLCSLPLSLSQSLSGVPEKKLSESIQ